MRFYADESFAGSDEAAVGCITMCDSEQSFREIVLEEGKEQTVTGDTITRGREREFTACNPSDLGVAQWSKKLLKIATERAPPRMHLARRSIWNCSPQRNSRQGAIPKLLPDSGVSPNLDRITSHPIEAFHFFENESRGRNP